MIHKNDHGPIDPKASEKQYVLVTFSMTSIGIDVYSFEPVQINIHLLHTSLCFSPLEIQCHVILSDFGLYNKAQEFIIVWFDNNTVDGQAFRQENSLQNEYRSSIRK